MRFLTTTIMRGTATILPLALIVTVLAFIYINLKPVAQALHEDVFPEARTSIVPALITIAAVALLLFLIGMVGHSLPGAKAMRWIDTEVARAVPTYGIVRQMIADRAGSAGVVDDATSPKVVLISADGQHELGFLVETRPDGLAVVYKPGAPAVTSGSVVFVRTENVTMTSLTASDVVLGLRKLGRGIPALGAVPPE